MDTETRLLHQTVLRLLKGIVRAYDTWLRVRLGQEAPSMELPAPTGSETNGTKH